MLLLRQDAGQVAAVQPALPLCSVPGATVREVLVAVRLELAPAEAANLGVWKKGGREKTKYITGEELGLAIRKQTKRILGGFKGPLLETCLRSAREMRNICPLLFFFLLFLLAPGFRKLNHKVLEISPL